MSARKRLLVLTPRFPYPPIGGDRLRIYQLCRHLSRQYELSLLSLCETEKEMHAELPDDGIFVSADRVLHGRGRQLTGALLAALRGKPLQVGYYFNPEFAAKCRTLLPQHDGVLAHLIRTAEYARQTGGVRILEMTDAISMTYLRGGAISAGRSLRGLLFRVEAKRLVAYDPWIVGQFDLTILTSETDRDFLVARGAQGAEKMVVCSNGVDTNALAYDFDPDGRTVVFIGINTAFHNLDALHYFAEEILPLVRKDQPDARFKIVGRIQPDAGAKLMRHAGVEVTGAVENIAESVRGAAVGVCPIRFGAGVQNKLLEYMSLGIPAVTSPIGLEGLVARPGEDLLVADRPAEWAGMISRLLKDRAYAEQIARAGRHYVEQHHSREAQFLVLDDRMERLFSLGR